MTHNYDKALYSSCAELLYTSLIGYLLESNFIGSLEHMHNTTQHNKDIKKLSKKMILFPVHYTFHYTSM